ncbi:MAG: DUF11 domain-containing protein, partial [Erysipelotrichales bacterium]|nr:DUF11 domain-containing protein [Erysipelotrichales bacterium]
SQVILIRGIISSDYSGLINNLAIVNSDTFDPNFLDNISQANVNVSQKIADMAIKKASNLSEVTLGEQIIYTLSINNLGPDNVSEAILYDNCINLTDPEYSVDNGLTWLTWNASLNMGAIAVNESLIVLLRGIVSANENFLVNTAKVLAEAFDPDFLNNSDTVVVSIKKELADISVNHSACSPCVRNCELVSFVILISNAGPSEAINVLLTHKLPKEIINPEYSVDNGKCFNKWFGNFHFPIINANTVKIIHIRGKVYANPGCIINSTAYAYADTEDSNLGNNKSTISLMVAKRLIPDSKCC